ncbi:MAG: Ni/Fe hydrogenase subunit gamma, partial [Aquificaceae bacterium]
LREGDVIYYRGPYGNGWNIEEAYDKELVIVSGGLGIAATRWIFQEAIDGRYPIRKVLHLYGSKDYESLLYRELYHRWEEKAEFLVTIDRPDERWNRNVGLITDLIKRTSISKDVLVFICGPDPMVKACILELREKGVKYERIYASLERHMKCSVGTCGHCMIGPFFVCKDGPIFRYDSIREYFERKEV